MEKKRTSRLKAPWNILIWVPVFLLNLFVIPAFQCLFVHTCAVPMTKSGLGSLPCFKGCEILYIEGGAPAGRLGKIDPNWVLCKDGAGAVHAVRLEWNACVPRFRIEKRTDTVIPEGEDVQTFTVPDFLAVNQVTVSGREMIHCHITGSFRQWRDILNLYLVGAFALVVAESGVLLLFRKGRGEGKGGKARPEPLPAL